MRVPYFNDTEVTNEPMPEGLSSIHYHITSIAESLKTMEFHRNVTPRGGYVEWLSDDDVTNQRPSH